jgi:hypothetical protein
MTCDWFRHCAGVNCIPVLTCQLHQGLIAHGRHLASRCQRWAIENQWHWSRDTQLGDDDHTYSQGNGVQVLARLRTLALNLLRSNGFHSIRAGLMAVAHDLRRMLCWVGISLEESG